MNTSPAQKDLTTKSTKKGKIFDPAEKRRVKRFSACGSKINTLCSLYLCGSRDIHETRSALAE